MAPVRMAVSMILNTVQSFRRSWPRMVWYLATPPFCSRKPKAIPVSRPSASCSGDSNSNMVAPLLAEDQEGRRNRRSEGEHDERPALRRELQAAADAVSAGAAAGDAGAEDHDGAAEEGGGEALRLAWAETPVPQRRYGDSRAVAGEPSAERRPDEDTDEQHEVPAEFRLEPFA